MTTITLTLTEELAAEAQAKGLLSSSAVEELLRKKIWEDEHPGFSSNFSGRPPWKVLSEEEARQLLADMDASRRRCKLSDDISIVDMIREERDER